MSKETIPISKLRTSRFIVALSVVVSFLQSDSIYCYGDQPNILWITSEDNGIELGCYGDDYATSPNIDSLASKDDQFEPVYFDYIERLKDYLSHKEH